MKILLTSYLFSPSVGGIETVSELLARQFFALGHGVQIVTQTPGATSYERIPVHRNPGAAKLLWLIRSADIVFHNNISLRFAWPLLFASKPWVIAHHTWIRASHGTSALPQLAKLFALRRATNISISKAIATHLPVSSSVIPDPYDSDIFYVRREIQRDRDLVFVGRLVSDKGVRLLISALAELRQQQITPTLTIIGDGPERSCLEIQIRELGLDQKVVFTGEKCGADLAWLLNQHRIIVVPSRWNEPFGIVALEGIACGCVALGSAGGGLADAIGPCGMTYPNGDLLAFVSCLRELLCNPARMDTFRSKSESHLKKHQPASVAEAYLKVFEAARTDD